MILQFGQFEVRLIDETKRFPAFPSRWDKAKPTDGETTDAVLRIQEASVASTAPMVEGWTEANICGRQSWVYSNGHNALFALQPGSTRNDVCVLVDGAASNSIRAGAQFGLLLALSDNCIGLHGATMLCGDEVVILSAPSGTGKTTLAHLLETNCDAVTVNGDFALLHPTEDGVIFEPTPFCGSSGRALNHRLRVDRVVFLKQGQTNVWNGLTGREAMRQFMNNSFVPDWKADALRTVQGNVMRCISSLATNTFSFAPDREAARVFFDHIKK